MLRLAALAHGRANNFQLVRLAAATAVVLFHSYALTDHWTDEPLWQRVPEFNFGALGVACFFVISGFLVTQSWLSRRRVMPFVAARVLRIYPALVAAVALTVVLGGASSALDWSSFLAHPQTLDYIVHVTPAWEIRHRLPGAFPTNPRIPGIDPMPLFAVGLALTLVAAALSWHCLERPALGLKSRFGPTDPTT